MTRCVLVVGDDKDVRDLLVEELQSAGYDTAELESGEHVVETALELRPHAIVLDLTRSRVAAYGALRQLKADPMAARIPVIVIIGPAGSGIARVDWDLEMADSLANPWRAGELIRRVEQAIDSATG